MTLTGVPPLAAAPAAARSAGPPPGGLGGWLRGVGVVAAVGMSVAAIVVTVGGGGGEPVGVVSEAGPVVVGGPADVALCSAIAPLIKESSGESRDFMAIRRAVSSAEMRQMMGPFREFVARWAPEAAGVVDAHPGASGYLARNLYRYIDDRRSYAAMLDPGPGDVTDKAAWADSLVALGAAFEVCGDVGVELW